MRADIERLRRLADLGDEDATRQLTRERLRRCDLFTHDLLPYVMDDEPAEWIRHRHRDLVTKHGVDTELQIRLEYVGRVVRRCIVTAGKDMLPAFEWIGVPLRGNRQLTVVAGVYCNRFEGSNQGHIANLVVGLTLVCRTGEMTYLMSVTDPACSWESVLNHDGHRRYARGWFNRRCRGRRSGWSSVRPPVTDRIWLVVDGTRIKRGRW